MAAISDHSTYFSLFRGLRVLGVAALAALCFLHTASAQAPIVRTRVSTAAAPAPDSVKAAGVLVRDTTHTAFTMRGDSSVVLADSLKKPVSGIDSSVSYTSTDSIVFSYPTKIMKMFGTCDVKYKTMALNSERIDVTWAEDKLDAYGVLDSSRAGNPDSIKQRYKGMPVMVDGSEKYEGFKIAYNFKTQKGRITLGETAKDAGFYYGEHIKKVEPDVLFISDGMFTTCSNGHPHYFFMSPEMRVTVKDKIVARPIYLYIADVPIFALPFGVFPSQGGRRSGIIAPAYGDDGLQGRYISHLGYYFALSDYYDLAASGDWYASGSWAARTHIRYNKRYDFNGDINVEYTRRKVGEPIDPDRQDQENYRASIVHNETFNPTTQLNVNFTFASNNSFLATNSISQHLEQQIYSNATFTKSWEGTNNLLSVNVQRVQNLINGSIDATLPVISFSNSQIYPFRPAKKSHGVSLGGDESKYTWLEMLGISYTGTAEHVEKKTWTSDTTDFARVNRSGVNHNLSFSLAPKAGYFTVQPSFSYQERWYDKSTEFKGLDTLKLPVFGDATGFNALRTFSTGVSVSTKLYGMLRSPIPGLAGFRHTVTPSLSYSYTPDFSKPFWKYYGVYRDSNNVEQKYSRFEHEIFGGATTGEQQSVSLSIGNLFETKTAPKDTAVKEQKYQLLNVNASLGYNFAATDHRLSDLNLSYRTSIGEYLSLSGNNTYSFYLYQKELNGRLRRFLINNNGGLMQLTNFYISLSTSLRGEKKKAETIEQKSDSARVEEKRRSLLSGYHTAYEDDVPDFSIPWNLAATFTYSQSQDNPDLKYRSANLGLNGGFNLTENWRFTASASYDVVNKQFAAPSINVYRDLHCWEMNFSWQPIGMMAGYRLEIRVKAPQLQDLKITKQSYSNGYYPY